MDFKKGYCGNGWAALTMLTFEMHSYVAGNFISVELTRNKKESNSFCKEISC